ncbi:MAG: HNH endonuclease [Actinobacteria bacterium]|nr:HNH endonuclease [Actinomycetota bacterium]MCA1720594.1 HNH endonuclease [Actinomycetota bacterium]
MSPSSAAPVDWSSRPVPTAMSPKRLAALVDRSISRTEGLLFTATPAEELDEIGRWQQLKDQAFAGQVRAIVAAYNRASQEEREFAADEVGLAVGATSTTGGNLVAQALAVAALPGLLESVEMGQLTERHVLAVLRELDKVELTLEQRHAVVLVMLARYRGQAPGELAALVARLIVQVDRAAAAARDAKATARRRVDFSRDVDGQALLLARGPAAAIAAIRASLEATLPADADEGDDRSREAREFDLFLDLLTGGAEAGSWQAEVVVPFSVAEGGELELAEIPGFGPLLPSTARDLLDHCDTMLPAAVDDGGAVIAVGSPVPLTDAADLPLQAAPAPDVLRLVSAPPALRDLTGSGYRFPLRLRRYMEARDRTCVFPGCGRPARLTDKDHRRPWPAGPTSADNGECLCRHHHRAKHAVFTVLLDTDGSYVWISRGGWQFRRHPKGF